MIRRVAILVFDGVTLLDAAGPAEVLCHVTGPGSYEITAVSAAGGELLGAARAQVLRILVNVADVPNRIFFECKTGRAAVPGTFVALLGVLN